MTTQSIETRQTPAVGTWIVDPSHSTIAAVARHLVVSKVRGTFAEFSGKISVGENPAESEVDITIETTSINTQSEDRDAHLRSPDFLDVENYPQITFKSTSVSPSGDNWTLNGELTMRGVTRPVSIDFEFLGTFIDPWGNEKAAFTGATRIEREEWGVNWNAPLEAGGLLVSKHLDIELEIQAALEA